MGALRYAVQLLGALPSLIQTGMDVTKLIQQGTAALANMQATGRDPTPAEWDALNTQITALRAELHSA